MSENSNNCATCLVMLVLFGVIVFVMSALLMLAWNAIALSFGWPQINFWVSLSILIVLGIVGRALGRR